MPETIEDTIEDAANLTDEDAVSGDAEAPPAAEEGVPAIPQPSPAPDAPRTGSLGALTAGTAQALVPSTYEESYKLARAIDRSRLAPFGLDNADKISIAILYGLELGIPPMQALSGIAVINNRPSLWGSLAVALVYKSGLLAEFKEWFAPNIDEETQFAHEIAIMEYEALSLDEQKKHGKPVPPQPSMTAFCTMKRAGLADSVTSTFSVNDAKRAGLWGNVKKDPWIKYPKRMLRWRARHQTMADLFPDILKGMVPTEIAGDFYPAGREVSRTDSLMSKLPGAAHVNPEGIAEEIEEASFTEVEHQLSEEETKIFKAIRRKIRKALTPLEVSILLEHEKLTLPSNATTELVGMIHSAAQEAIAKLQAEDLKDVA